MKGISLYIKDSSYKNKEAYKTLRTNIAFAGSEKKAIVMTSCTPNEGKSTVVVNLAQALADAGKKVLVIDADLRKSVLTKRHLITDQREGLSHYLSDQSKFEDVICKTDKGFHLILAGAYPPNPSELLGSKRFESLLMSVRSYYDYILIDTPPLGNVIDSVVVAKVCDAAVLVMESGAISRKYARKVKAQLEMSGCKILGVVLNKVDMTQDKYYGKYYGKYGE